MLPDRAGDRKSLALSLFKLGKSFTKSFFFSLKFEFSICAFFKAIKAIRLIFEV